MAWSQDGTSPSSTTYMWNLGHGSDCNLSVLFGDTRTVSKILLTSRQRTVGLCWGPENKGSKEILDPFRKLSLIMASGPITSWEIDGETVTDFIFLGSKITADGDCSHEIKRCLLLGRKVTTNLESVLKSRDITLPTKVHLVKAMVFPIVMYGCESWTVMLEKTLESPLDCKEITPANPEGNQT